MSKFERRIWFDGLVELRDRYHHTERIATSMSVEQAIAYAIQMLDAEVVPTDLDVESSTNADATADRA